MNVTSSLVHRHAAHQTQQDPRLHQLLSVYDGTQRVYQQVEEVGARSMKSNSFMSFSVK